MRQRLFGAGFGVAFGFWLAWSRMTEFDPIVGALLFQRAYLWLLFATGVLTTVVGLQILRGIGAVTLLGHEALRWPTVAPQRRHVVGSLLFGAGWALAGACPGPIVAQVGAGRLSSLFTLAGMFGGIALADACARRVAQSVAASPCAGEAYESLA